MNSMYVSTLSSVAVAKSKRGHTKGNSDVAISTSCSLVGPHEYDIPPPPPWPTWHNIFIVDAAQAPNVVKALARPGKLDEHLQEHQSSSFFASESAQQLGCNIKFIGDDEDWEFARLIFSDDDSTVFPGEELVGFWYDQDNRYHEDAEYNERPLEDPLLESL
ncbi:hypothetical protein C8J57DRAFT_1508460 [Mycena rebaudengoi]|nr:hypothetical protein C8J57DRAFT_1508460 [Mycena rebaudengoi]